MIGKSQLQLLSIFDKTGDESIPISALAERLGWSTGHTSRIVSELRIRGGVQTTSHGREQLVSRSDADPYLRLHALMNEYSHVNFPKLLFGAGLKLLYYLDHDQTATELVELSTTSRATVYRRLNELQAVGIVGKIDSHYHVNEPFSELPTIARRLAHHDHRHEATRYVDGVKLVWETHNEYLFACDTDVSADEYFLTGPSLFADFDIQMFTRSRRHYYHSDRISAVSPTDLVCHTLLIDQSSRYRTYSLLLIQGKSLTKSELVECAEHYAPEAKPDLIRLVEQLVEYLETEGEAESDQFPAWKDFKSTARQYEIDV